MRTTKRTKAAYETYLNNVLGDRYGSKLRRNDPIQFDVGFNEWDRA